MKKMVDKKSLLTECSSLLLLLSAMGLAPFAMAEPSGGQVVGGAGSIAYSGNTTTINQAYY